MVINGSARTDKGNTAFVLSPIITGMENAGADVELIYSKKQKIRPCIGCFKCWYETIGKCCIQDDMQAIYPKLMDSDIVFFATPVYIPLPGLMQNFINRLCPLIEPIVSYRNGRTRAKLHNHVKISKFVGLITGGWWEIENLNIVKNIIEELALNASVELAGVILRPHAYVLKEDTELNKKILSILEQIGEKLIIEGKISQEDQQFVSQSLVSKEVYLNMLNSDYNGAKRKYKEIIT